MDDWSSLAQAFKVRVIARLEQNRKTGTNTARAPRPLSWLIPRARWCLATALLDWLRHLLGAGRTWSPGRVAPGRARGDYLWGVRRGLRPQVKSLEAQEASRPGDRERATARNSDACPECGRGTTGDHGAEPTRWRGGP